MKKYRIGYKLPDGTVKFDEITAGDVQCEAGVLIFKTSVGTNSIICAYKTWDFMVLVNDKGVA